MKNNLSINLIYYKKLRKMTNQKLAELTGLPVGTISRIASGETKEPKLKTLRLLAQALECSINDLQFDENEIVSKNKVDSISLNKNEKVLLKLFKCLDEDIQKSIIALLESISKKKGGGR